MRRTTLAAALGLMLSACCMTDEPGGATAFAVNRCAFSVTGLPVPTEGPDPNRTYIDENPTLERLDDNNTVSYLSLQCRAQVGDGGQVILQVTRIRNQRSFQILDSEPGATWEVRVSGDGSGETYQGASGGESSASVRVEAAAGLRTEVDARNLASSFSFSVVDYETGGEGRVVSVEGTTQ